MGGYFFELENLLIILCSALSALQKALRELLAIDDLIL